MLDTSNSLLPINKPVETLRGVAVGFDHESLEELVSLLETLKIKNIKTQEVQIRKINSGTYMGTGQLEDLKGICHEYNPDFVVIDHELSPNQLRNLEKHLGHQVLDRSGVIIEIFSRHAHTKEAKTQVELAKVQYMLPRLAHFWSHFERQRGGGVGNRGMGEKQLEVDRRLMSERIKTLKARLKRIEKERKVQRASREDVLKIAFVGYTNAGKSTLLNSMTQSKVLAEDKLFATLDSTVRAVDPDSHPPIIAIDTVGFIRNIPTFLIASFRSTLEELEHADLLVHVVDASSPYVHHHLEVTKEILSTIDLGEKPVITVLNKWDKIEDQKASNLARIASPGAERVSALDPLSVQKLKKRVLNYFFERLEDWEVVIPYSESKTESMIRKYANIQKSNFLQKGTFYQIKIDRRWAGRLNLKRFKS